MIARTSLIGLCSTLSAAAATAQEDPAFDCAKAEGPVQTMICGDAELAARDRALADVYARALERVEGDPAQVAGLKAERRGWIKERDDCGKAVDPRACAAGAYVDKIAEVSAAYGLVDAGRTHVWTCGEADMTVYVTPFETDPPAANIVFADESTTALRRPSTSGVHYEGPFGLTFTEKGHEARLESPGSAALSCRSVGPLKE